MRYLLVLLLPIVSFLVGCGKTDGNVAVAQTPTTNSAEQAEESKEQKSAEPQGLQPDPAYPIPDLTPAQLVNYINQLATLEPRGETDDEYIADQLSRAKSRLLAADRIITAKGIAGDLLEAGVRAKLDALRMLAILDPDPKGWGNDFNLFIDALDEGDSEKFSRMGRLSKFWLAVDKLVYGQSSNAEALMSGLDTLLKDQGAGEAEFLAAQDAAFVMNDRGYPAQATEALKKIGNRFLDDDKLGKEAKELLEKTEFREQVIAAMNGGLPEIKTLFTSIRGMLQDKSKLNVETLDNTLNAAQVLEFNGHFGEARRVFIAVRKAFGASEDEKLAKQAKIAVDFAERRLGMVGKDLELEGDYIDGTDFSWNKYKGKVVLVDFWASTSAAWQDSLPNIKTAYDRFHKDGFEVIGINVDHDRQRAYEYIRGERLPWPTIVDDIANGLDGNPNAIRYGIRAVPFVMLVGRDGKVANIHIRGPELSKRIEELLSEPTSQNARSGQSVRK